LNLHTMNVEFTLFANQRSRVPPEEAAAGETVAAK
jgi:hypothetical protein